MFRSHYSVALSAQIRFATLAYWQTFIASPLSISHQLLRLTVKRVKSGKLTKKNGENREK